MGRGHSHSHQHDDSHSHHPKGTDDNIRRILFVLVLTASFMAIEFVYGYLSNSLALMADAVHMLTDVAALALTYFAFKLSRKPPTARSTFGYYRFEILAAFINGILLAVLSIGIVWEAFGRLSESPDVQVNQMLIVAICGLVINLISGAILLKGDHANLNLRGALLHVLGDALASVGTIVASVLIIWKGWVSADAVVSIVIAIIVMISAYRLITETVHIILQGAPLNIGTDEIEKALGDLPSVVGVHHLHVWSLTSNMIILSVHLVVQKCSTQDLLIEAQKLLKDRFEIKHSTIQIELESLEHQEPRLS